MARALRGFTLIEMLMAGVLGLLLLGLFFLALAPTGRLAARESVKMELAQLAALTLRHVSDDLETSVSAGVTTSVYGSLAIHPLGGLDTDGNQVYANRLVLYHRDPNGGVWRREWTGGSPFALPPDRPRKVTAGELNQLLTPPDPQERRIARFVTALSISGSQPLNVTVRLQAPDSLETFSASQLVNLRNNPL